MIVRSEAGTKVQVLSDSVCIKLGSASSKNNMAVVTVEVPPGGFVPPHTHRLEEEGYYMLTGAMVMRIGDEESLLCPGDFAYVAQGQVHGYRNDTNETIRFLAWTVGGAIDEFFIEMGQTVRKVPEDLSRMPQVLEKYGVQMV